jgi:hypothetical protein
MEKVNLDNFPRVGNVLVTSHLHGNILDKISEIFNPWIFKSKYKSKFKKDCKIFVDNCLLWNQSTLDNHLCILLNYNIGNLVLQFCDYDGRHMISTNATHAPMYLRHNFVPYLPWIDAYEYSKNLSRTVKLPHWSDKILVLFEGHQFLKGFDYVIFRSDHMENFNKIYEKQFDAAFYARHYKNKILMFDAKKSMMLDCANL